MGLKSYNEDDGIVVSRRKGNRWYNKTITKDNEEWLYTYWEITDEDVTEWPALQESEANGKVNDNVQPDPEIWDTAQWEMMEDQREVGSYILTRTRSWREKYLMSRVKMEETG